MPLTAVRRHIEILSESELLSAPSEFLGRIEHFEHQWVHWIIDRSATVDTVDDESEPSTPKVIAVCLEKMATFSKESAPYDGRNWFTGPEVPGVGTQCQRLDSWWRQGMPRMFQESVSSVPAKRKSASVKSPRKPGPNKPEVSLQYSFPLKKCSQVAKSVRECISRHATADHERIIVELKFLRLVALIWRNLFDSMRRRLIMLFCTALRRKL